MWCRPKIFERENQYRQRITVGVVDGDVAQSTTADVVERTDRTARVMDGGIVRRTIANMLVH